MKERLLLFDGLIYFLLGFLIVIFPVKISEKLGLPYPENPFYFIMIGSLIVGLGVAVLIEFFNPNLQGLGLCGSVAINICVIIVLVICLFTGIINLPFKTKIIVIFLISIFIVLSGAKIIVTEIKNKSCFKINKKNENREISKDNS